MKTTTTLSEMRENLLRGIRRIKRRVFETLVNAMQKANAKYISRLQDLSYYLDQAENIALFGSSEELAIIEHAMRVVADIRFD